MKIQTYLLCTAICAAFTGIFCPTLHAADPAEAKTIGRIIRERPDLSAFLQLLDKTELGSRLSERTNTSNTVFAPTDAAFAKLPEGALATLLDPRNKDRLDEVFGFHVDGGSQSAYALEKYTALQMTTGQFLSLDYKNGKIGESNLTGEVIRCSNGVIYLIDAVLTPNTDDLFQRLQKDGRFTIFTKAITASRQGKLFQNMHSSYTTFAPTDEAFKKLPPEFVDSLFLPENDERLEDIVKHHIVEGIFAAGKIPGFRGLGVSDVTPISAFNQQINFKVTDESASVDGATITEVNIPCANGIIHVIDSVMPLAEDGVLGLLMEDERFQTLVTLLEFTGLSKELASSTPFTIFAPTDEAWKADPYAGLIASKSEEAREILYGILCRHVIVGKHVSENCLPYNKLRTIHQAPIYLIRDGSQQSISGISIVETDKEGFNGLLNVIGSVIPDPMELPEAKISAIDAITFVQETLTEASILYTDGKHEASWRYYIKRGYEFISKYGTFVKTDQLKVAIFDDQPVTKFANEAWDARNAFRDILRQLEQREDSLNDNYRIQQPVNEIFGR